MMKRSSYNSSHATVEAFEQLYKSKIVPDQKVNRFKPACLALTQSKCKFVIHIGSNMSPLINSAYNLKNVCRLC